MLGCDDMNHRNNHKDIENNCKALTEQYDPIMTTAIPASRK
jgi:hypothetical protein